MNGYNGTKPAKLVHSRQTVSKPFKQRICGEIYQDLGEKRIKTKKKRGRNELRGKDKNDKNSSG